MIAPLAAPLAAETVAPEAVVQAQFDAYNAHDIDAFMATYASDAEIYEYPAKLLMNGAEQIADFYASKRFNDPRLHGTIAKRIVMGEVVIDHEQIVLTHPEGPGRLEAVAIYEVRAGKIQKVTLIRGRKSLDAPAQN
ncbi:MAG: nuclear transport factor 2 family protein [Burkholderiaceae bacterium]|nr:nuclear transport factor 2 family protein [Roseateles sp.]MBV8470852.1 nuclear transport factor 2 family protein [Burkholderiaceae bacterium]